MVAFVEGCILPPVAGSRPRLLARVVACIKRRSSGRRGLDFRELREAVAPPPAWLLCERLSSAIPWAVHPAVSLEVLSADQAVLDSVPAGRPRALPTNLDGAATISWRARVRQSFRAHLHRPRVALCPPGRPRERHHSFKPPTPRRAWRRTAQEGRKGLAHRPCGAPQVSRSAATHLPRRRSVPRHAAGWRRGPL